MTTFAKARLLVFLTLLSTIARSATTTNPKKVPKNAVLLSKVSALTVRVSKQTSSRRVSPVPQLQCAGPSRICSLYAVDVMRCTNEGSDYDEGNVQWNCRASLPEEFKLGSTDVTCEGYESSEDPYVLRGSCGVEYRLLLTDKGEEKYGSGSWFDSGSSGGSGNKGEKVAGYLFMGLFLVVLFIIARGIYNAWRNDAPRRRPRGGGGFGGFGGGGDDNDPPPPYDPQPSRPKKPTWPSASSSRTGTTGGGQQGQAWRPGMWTGAAAGAAAGYFAGRGARTQPDPPPPARPAFGGGWFGRGGDDGYTAPPRQSPPARTASSSSSSYSTTRHESTGFGGTSRR